MVNKGRSKTISKHFYDDEIHYKLANGDLYLKEGVKRIKKKDDEEEDETEETASLLIHATNENKLIEEDFN